MAIITSGVAANSYVSEDEATAIAEDLGATTWQNFDINTSPESVLQQASLVIDSLRFSGTRADDNQVLEFPRRGYFYRDDRQVAYPMEDGSYIVPKSVQKATILQAEYLLQKPNLLFTSGGAEEARLGALVAKGIIPASLIPTVVRQLLSPFTQGATASSGILWRAA